MKRGVGRRAGVGGGSAARSAAALIESSCEDGAAGSCSICSSVAATSESACCRVSLMLAARFSAEVFGQLERTRRATHRVARRGSDSDRADTPAAARDEVVATGASPCAGCPASCSMASTGAATASGSARGSCALPRAALDERAAFDGTRGIAGGREVVDREVDGGATSHRPRLRRKQVYCIVLYCIVLKILFNAVGIPTTPTDLNGV